MNAPAPHSAARAAADRWSPARLERAQYTIDYRMQQARQARTDALAALIRRGAGAAARVLGRLFGTAAARRAEAERAAFLARIGMDLRGPLAAIRAHAELLRDHPELPAEQRARLIATVLTEDERLARLIDDIMGASDFAVARGRWEIRAEALPGRLRQPAA